MSISRLLLLFLLGALCACSDMDDNHSLGTAKSCDVAVAQCELQKGGYFIKFSLGKEVKPLQPFDVRLQIDGQSIEPQDVVVDFIMVGMDMGLNRYRLVDNNGFWSGRATLPVCTASRTDWLAKVEFRDNGRQYVASFPFHTDAN